MVLYLVMVVCMEVIFELFIRIFYVFKFIVCLWILIIVVSRKCKIIVICVYSYWCFNIFFDSMMVVDMFGVFFVWNFV